MEEEGQSIPWHVTGDSREVSGVETHDAVLSEDHRQSSHDIRVDVGLNSLLQNLQSGGEQRKGPIFSELAGSTPDTKDTVGGGCRPLVVLE